MPPTEKQPDEEGAEAEREEEVHPRGIRPHGNSHLERGEQSRDLSLS